MLSNSSKYKKNLKSAKLQIASTIDLEVLNKT